MSSWKMCTLTSVVRKLYVAESAKEKDLPLFIVTCTDYFTVSRATAAYI